MCFVWLTFNEWGATERERARDKIQALIPLENLSKIFHCCQWYSCAGRILHTDKAPAATYISLMWLLVPNLHRGILTATKQVAESVRNLLLHSLVQPEPPVLVVPRRASQNVSCPQRMPTNRSCSTQETWIRRRRWQHGLHRYEFKRGCSVETCHQLTAYVLYLYLVFC